MLTLTLSLVLPLFAPSAELQRQRPEGSGGPPGPSIVDPIQGERIVWYGTLKQGRAVAAQTERPILLISAAPSCREVPGVW